jgi:3-deoxy-D-manno-octulosonic-acid transferase
MLEPLYRGLTLLAAPAVRPWLRRRARHGREDLARLGERFGHAGRARPAGRLAWVHGASVGESLSALPLARALLTRDPGLSVLMTTGTVSAASVLAGRLTAGPFAERAFHQFVPVDLPHAVNRFLDHWRPDLVLWTESELWPNLLGAIRRRHIPAALVNARMSEKSHRSWRRLPGTAARLLSAFRLGLAQSEADAQRFRRLGLSTEAPGNLKFAADPLPAEAAELARLRDAFGARPLWLLASSHPGEEELAGAAHLRLKRLHPELLTLIVPRHAARGPEIAAGLRQQGLATALRSEGALPAGADDVYVADTMGELGLWYRLSPITVIGKSLHHAGGQNPIEPAQLGSAVLFGPGMGNFAEIATEMRHAGGAVAVEEASGDALAAAIGPLLGDARARSAVAAAGRLVAERNRASLEQVIAALDPVLAEAGIGGTAS